MDDFDFSSIWVKYGLKETPFSTAPLRLFGTLPIEKVFADREDDLKVLGKRINSANSTRSIIVGEPGVGKTSFGNYLRWLLCIKKKTDKKYITPPIEIKLQNDWNAKQFLRSTLAAIYNGSKIFDWDEKGIKIKAMAELKSLLKASKQKSGGGNIQVLGSGGGVSYGESLSLPQDIAIEVLEDLFLKIFRELREQNLSLILQYNNIENMDAESLSNLLKSVRDFIQIDGLHTLFSGSAESISAFEIHPQVRSVFSDPIVLEPLSAEQVISVLEKRCEALKVTDGNYIRPFKNESVIFLHKMLNGNIRFIFKLLDDVTTRMQSAAPCKITVEDIQYYGSQKSKEYVANLTPNEKKVLFALFDKGELSLTELSDETKIAQSNLSTNEIKSLKAKGYVATYKNPSNRRFTMVKLSQSTRLIVSFVPKELK
ncbi:hypothetical protein HQ545_01315 [Candidatus Woesearchaeota archaeon]|nr:hypothetical protein [Candidatus Woesearchaeota archaeon]